MAVGINEVTEHYQLATRRAFEDARTMPSAVYLDTELAKLEAKRLFEREWICVGRSAELANRGDFLTFDITDHPVLVVRQDDMSLQAFLNVCVHRSATLAHGSGNTRRFVCPYHAWAYDLGGQLVGTRFMDRTPGFEHCNHHLQRLNTEIWQGFIYVSLNDDATPVADRLSGLASVIDRYRIADYRHAFTVEESWPANWKCFVENFMDAYHIFKVHAATFGQTGHYEDVTRMFDGERHYTYHLVDSREGDPSGLAHPDNHWLDEESRRTTVLACVFPSHTMQLQPDMLWYVTVQPEGVDRFRMKWSVSIPDEVLTGVSDADAHIAKLREFLTAVNTEDHAVVGETYKGLRADANFQTPMSWLERNVYRFAQYVAREVCA